MRVSASKANTASSLRDWSMLYVSSYLGIGNENFRNFVKVAGWAEHIPPTAGPCPFAGSAINDNHSVTLMMFTC